MELLEIPRAFPQFGKSTWNIGRDRRQVFSPTAHSKGGCMCGGDGRGECGCGGCSCSSCQFKGTSRGLDSYGITKHSEECGECCQCSDEQPIVEECPDYCKVLLMRHVQCCSTANDSSKGRGEYEEKSKACKATKQAYDSACGSIPMCPKEALACGKWRGCSDYSSQQEDEDKAACAKLTAQYKCPEAMQGCLQMMRWCSCTSAEYNEDPSRRSVCSGWENYVNWRCGGRGKDWDNCIRGCDDDMTDCLLPAAAAGGASGLGGGGELLSRSGIASLAFLLVMGACFVNFGICQKRCDNRYGPGSK